MRHCNDASAFETVQQLRLSPGFQTLTVGDVRLVITQHSVDDKGKFSCDSSDSGVVVFPLGTLLLIEGRKYRVMECRNICRQPNRPSHSIISSNWRSCMVNAAVPIVMPKDVLAA